MAKRICRLPEPDVNAYRRTAIPLEAPRNRIKASAVDIAFDGLIPIGNERSARRRSPLKCARRQSLYCVA